MFIPRTIATAVNSIARHTIGKDWSLYAALLDRWPEIVGSEYAKSVTPVKITFPRKKSEGKLTDGVLHVRVPKGLAMEFTYITDTMRQRITGFLGHDAIGRIVLEPYYEENLPIPRSSLPPADPVAMADLRAKTQDVEDEALREALEKLGESVLRARG